MRRPAARRSLGVSRGFFFPPSRRLPFAYIIRCMRRPPCRACREKPACPSSAAHAGAFCPPASRARLRTCGARPCARAGQVVPGVRIPPFRTCGMPGFSRAASAHACLPALASRTCVPWRDALPPLCLFPCQGRDAGAAWGGSRRSGDFFPGMAKKAEKYLEVSEKPLTLLPMIFFL